MQRTVPPAEPSHRRVQGQLASLATWMLGHATASLHSSEHWDSVASPAAVLFRGSSRGSSWTPGALAGERRHLLPDEAEGSKTQKQTPVDHWPPTAMAPRVVGRGTRTEALALEWTGDSGKDEACKLASWAPETHLSHTPAGRSTPSEQEEGVHGHLGRSLSLALADGQALCHRPCPRGRGPVFRTCSASCPGPLEPLLLGSVSTSEGPGEPLPRQLPGDGLGRRGTPEASSFILFYSPPFQAIR